MKLLPLLAFSYWISTPTSQQEQNTTVPFPLFCYSAEGGYDCVTRCVEACGYSKTSSNIEAECLARLPSHCTVQARPKYVTNLLTSSCSTAYATRFQFSALPEASKPATTTSIVLSKATLLLSSAAFTWANCNATQIWAVGQLLQDPTEENVTDCSLPNYGYGERISPGDFVKPLHFELDLTEYFAPKFDGVDLTQEEFLFQLSAGTDNAKCSGDLTTANFTVVQTVTMAGQAPSV